MLFSTLVIIALVIAVIVLCFVFLKQFIPAAYANVIVGFIAFVGCLYILLLIAGLVLHKSYVPLIGR